MNAPEDSGVSYDTNSELSKPKIQDEATVESQEEHVKYPIQVFFIVINEVCERFSYFGMRTILSLYLANVLLYSESDSTIIYHIFVMFTYFFPIIGAIISDCWWGKFQTIMYVSIIYAIGNTVLAVAAIDTIDLPHREISILGLFLIAIGTGGIKPCVSAFGGDQFVLPQQEVQLAAFFSLFYFAINIGGMISTFLTPVLREDVHCFGADTCYSLSFGVSGVFMFISIIVFVLGKPLYKISKPKGNVMVDVGKCMTYAVKEKIKSDKKYDYWLDYAREKYGDQLIEDVKITLKVLVLYLPLPIFWALYDQQGSAWTFQAVRMNGDFGSFTILPDQMQIVNPLLILVFIPLFNYCIYPLLDKCHFLQSPLKRMVCGGLLAAAAFAISACVSLALEGTYPELPTEGNAQIRFYNPTDCDGILKTELFDKDITLSPMGYTELEVALKGTKKLPYEIDGCRQPYTGDITVKEEKSAGYFLTTSGLKYFEDDIDKSEDGFPKIRILAADADDTMKIEILDSDGDVSKSVTATNSTSISLSPGTYSIKGFGTKFEVGLGAVYRILLRYADQSLTVRRVTDVNSINILWLLPQYIVITAGEILFSVTGLEFSYSQAPVSMKSFLQAAFLLTTAIGNLIIALIESAQIFEDQSNNFFLYAGLMVADMVLFAYLAYNYQYVNVKQGDNDNEEQEDGQNNGSFIDDERLKT